MQINNFSLSYGDSVIYDNFCLDIKEGQTLCIMGSSGSGKTTLLKAIVGLVDYKGNISGVNKVGYVFQNNALIPTISCEKNCLFVMNESNALSNKEANIAINKQYDSLNYSNNGKLENIDKVENSNASESDLNKKCNLEKTNKIKKNNKDKSNLCKNDNNKTINIKNCKFNFFEKRKQKQLIINLNKEYIANIFEKLSISYCLKKMPTQISGGEASRVSIARALCYNTDLLLLDEPFRGLDIANKFYILNLFMKITKEQHKTVIFVSHDIDDCLRFGDRIIVIKRNEENGIKIVGDFDLNKESESRANNDYTYNSTIDETILQTKYFLETKRNIFDLLTKK